MERPLVGRGRKERNSEDRCTAVNECFRLERNFPREKKIFKTFFTFREGKEKGRKKEKDSCPVVSVSIFHPPPHASLSIFIVTRLEPLSRSFRALPPFDESSNETTFP